MKKIVSMIIGIFFIFSFVGCNSGSELDVNMSEFINAPINLRIEGDSLLWDPVENASGYIVYINDEEVDSVGRNVTTYAFDSSTEDVLIFQLKTKSPWGMQDSPISAKIAYVPNKTQEIASINTILQSEGVVVVPGFAEELVNKGMVSADVQALFDAYDSYLTLISTAREAEDYLVAINVILGEAKNIEAIVSGVVNTYLVDYIQEEIDDIDDYLLNPSVSNRNELLEEKAGYEEFLDSIDDNPDSIVLSITQTLEYLLDIESAVSYDLVGSIEELYDADTDDLNASELYEIKQEIVGVFRDTIPTQEEMILLVEFLDVVQSVSSLGTNDYSTVKNYKGKLAAQSLYGIEIYINLFDEFEVEDLQSIIDNENSTDLTNPMIDAENNIVLIQVFDRFYDENRKLFDTFNDVFTDEEKVIMFEQSKSEYSAPMLIGGFTYYNYPSMSPDIEIADMIELQDIFEDGFAEFLNELIESDCEIIRQIAIAEEYYFNNDYMSIPEFGNDANGETYTATEYYYNKEITNVKIQQLTIDLMNAIANTIDSEEMDVITKTVFLQQFNNEIVIPALDTLAFEGVTDDEISLANALLVDTLVDNNSDILDLLKDLTKYLSDENVFDNYLDVLEDSNTYYISEYGNDYLTNYGMLTIDDDYRENADLIYNAKTYTEFMDQSNKDKLYGVIEDLFTLAKNNDMESFVEALIIYVEYNIAIKGDIIDFQNTLSDAQLDSLYNEIIDYFDELSISYDRIDRFNYNDLDSSDLAIIQEVKDDIQEKADDILAVVLVPSLI